ncbi:MAG: endonuclease/exonuclease/phosphatase family protein [Chitinophagales bacterium]
MSKLVKRLFKLLFTLAFLYGLYIGGTIIYATITDYRPKEIIELPLRNSNYQNPRDSIFTFLSWNIGYAGLGAEEDFFYDGGKSVRAPENRTRSYFSGIKRFLIEQNTDFILLQEVDSNARRSYLKNQYKSLTAELNNYVGVYAPNYKVRHVPAPFERPWDRLGRIHSGLVSFSKYQPTEAERYQFPGNFDWPKRVFMLDRCFLLKRFKLSNGKDLVVINTHNSAFDDGSLRSKQMAYLRDIVLDEYESGNYVVVGGDWNQVPPGTSLDLFVKDSEHTDINRKAMETGLFPENWKWAYDESKSTNRDLKAAWNPKICNTYIVDFYLVSPNIETQEVKTIDMNYKHSDHQPVLLKIKLKDFN